MFKCKQKKFDNMQFVGLQIEAKSNDIILHTNNYFQKLTLLHSKAANYAYFRPLSAQILLTTKTRLDICCAVTFLAHVIEENFERNRGLNFKTTIKVVRKLEDSNGVQIATP